MKKKVSQEVIGKSRLVLLTLFVCAFALWAQKPAPPAAEYKIPPEAAAKQNPVKPTEESLTKAKKFYTIDCAMCHGQKGDGKNDMDMKNVPDLTTPDTLKARTDGELFYIIRNGKADMPPEGDRAKDNDIWDLVNLVRSFAKK